LPALAVIIPVEAELGELAADFLGRRFGEGDPDPPADNLGQVELVREPLAQEVQDLAGGERTILLALLEVHVGENAGGLRRNRSSRWLLLSVGVGPFDRVLGTALEL
jgi:hypothetical protein